MTQRDPDTEVLLAKREAVKRFRSAVRLETSIAADYVIGRHLPRILELIDKELNDGGLPALEEGMGSKAREIADALSEAFERAIEPMLALEPGE